MIYALDLDITHEITHGYEIQEINLINLAE